MGDVGGVVGTRVGRMRKVKAMVKAKRLREKGCRGWRTSRGIGWKGRGRRGWFERKGRRREVCAMVV